MVIQRRPFSRLLRHAGDTEDVFSTCDREEKALFIMLVHICCLIIHLCVEYWWNLLKFKYVISFRHIHYHMFEDENKERIKLERTYTYKKAMLKILTKKFLWNNMLYILLYIYKVIAVFKIWKWPTVGIKIINPKWSPKIFITKEKFLIKVIIERKIKRPDSILWQKPLHPQKIQNATQKFDYTRTAGRLRTVNLSNDSHPTGRIKPLDRTQIVLGFSSHTIESSNVTRLSCIILSHGKITV